MSDADPAPRSAELLHRRRAAAQRAAPAAGARPLRRRPRLPRMAHVAFVRSPHAHARIVSIDARRPRRRRACSAWPPARTSPGAARPGSACSAHMKGLNSPPQHPLAVDRAAGQGEPVAAVVADTRAEAEDAAALVRVEWRAAAGAGRSGGGARAGHAGDPPGARRQPRLPRDQRGRRGRRGLRRRDEVVEARSSAVVTPASRSSRARSSPTGTRPATSSRSTSRARRRT